MRFIRRCSLITTEHKKNPRPNYKNSYYWEDRKEHSLQRWGNHRYPKLMVGGIKIIQLPQNISVGVSTYMLECWRDGSVGKALAV